MTTEAEMNTTLSSTNIAQLTGIVRGMAQPRSENKASAVSKLVAALAERIGEDSAAIAEAIMKEETCEGALRILKVALIRHDSARGAPTTRLENTTINGLPTTGKIGTGMEAKKKDPRGRKADLAGKHLLSTKQQNPRRDGSHGQKSLQIIIDSPGITTEDFLEAGGRMTDLKLDIKNARVVVD